MARESFRLSLLRARLNHPIPSSQHPPILQPQPNRIHRRHPIPRRRPRFKRLHPRRFQRNHFTRIAHAIMDLLTQSREDSLNMPGRPTRSHEDHRRVLAAIARRDPDAARRAMLEHIEAVETLVLGADATSRVRHGRRPA